MPPFSYVSRILHLQEKACMVDTLASSSCSEQERLLTRDVVVQLDLQIERLRKLEKRWQARLDRLTPADTS